MATGRGNSDVFPFRVADRQHVVVVVSSEVRCAAFLECLIPREIDSVDAALFSPDPSMYDVHVRTEGRGGPRSIYQSLRTNCVDLVNGEWVKKSKTCVDVVYGSPPFEAQFTACLRRKNQL